MRNIKFTIVWLYVVLAYLFFGGMLSTIITQYSNWDYNLPNSLVTTNSFYAIANPGTFYQLFGKINMPIFIIMIIAIWKFKIPRNLFLVHFVTFFIIGLGTGLLIYPILYEFGTENVAERPVAELEMLLKKFKTFDFIRSIIALFSLFFLTFAIKEFCKVIYTRRF